MICKYLIGMPLLTLSSRNASLPHKVEHTLRFPAANYYPFRHENRQFEHGLWEYTCNFSNLAGESAKFGEPMDTGYRETDDTFWTFDNSHASRTLRERSFS